MSPSARVIRNKLIHLEGLNDSCYTVDLRVIRARIRTKMKEMYMFRLILVRFDQDSGRFEDDEFNKFCAEQNIVRIEKEFINSNGEIYYSFFIEYHSRKAGYEKPDMAKLSEREQEQYNRLRDWRNELAANEGIPAYIIMYNSQIYEIVKRQPVAKADFAAIKGMKGKADKYGEQIIKLLQEAALEPEE